MIGKTIQPEIAALIQSRDFATLKEILVDFPDLQPKDIRACIAYAARYLDHTILVSA